MKRGPVNATTAPHYRWGDGCDGWRLLDGADLSVIEEAMPPGTAEVPHRHGQARQLFYVLTGALEIEMGGVAHRLAAGDGLHVPPQESHQVRNSSDGPVRFLVISAPTTRGDRLPV